MNSPETFRAELKVVVADDYALTRSMIKSILRQLGFQNVITYENGDSLLDEVLQNGAGLVVCDWNMPGRSGLEVLQTIRKDERFKDLPFLMLTAEVYRENVVEAMKAGVSDYIAKPFTAQILGQKIDQVLKGK
jgi:two-component system chemotaxis response regulator CheY